MSPAHAADVPRLNFELSSNVKFLCAQNFAAKGKQAPRCEVVLFPAAKHLLSNVTNFTNSSPSTELIMRFDVMKLEHEQITAKRIIIQSEK